MLILEKGLKGINGFIILQGKSVFPLLILIRVNEFLILMFTFATVLHTL